ncbi:TPA: ABC transporter ATP-binding protein [Candidatus Dependentiae bacterium]|nr:MAG: Xenobiotic-transporting ATPase [candidate division TM6 bacterium GW2011_GWE2_31_21]KKP53932.1 MAG: Xenobiotic-transporting ATPase [candidate division TM6 bacterium GW2011_GWF2_33_332]HBS47712.1 ABC transporter ATP-binding protein [Candidatus Dependentiae bacterium]HBZ73861.1 ABC transporter ATP-binding protein [Candidatus Dependentiae bacterium]
MNTLKRIFSYTKKYWKRLVLSIIAATAYGIISAAPTYLIKFLVDKVFVERLTYLLIPFVIIMISLFLVKGLFMYLSNYYMNWVGSKVVNDIRLDLFKKIIYYPTSFYQEKTTGDLMSHFLSDITMIQNASSSAIKNGVRSFFEAIFLLLVAVYQTPKLACVILILGPVIAFIIKRMGTNMRETARRSQNSMGSISSILQEMFIGIREIKSFNAENSTTSKFAGYLHNYFSSIMKNVQAISITPALIEIIAMSSFGIIFYVAALQVLSGSITPGQLTSFFAAMLFAYQPLKRLINVYTDVQSGIASANRVFEVMDKTYPTQKTGNIIINNFSNALTFENVSFEYNKNQPVLKNISIKLNKGETIGMVGPSGSGKSTFCDLLLGFIEPSNGAIKIDGIDLRTISTESLRSQIGYVGQKTFLFNDTIFANISYAKPNATMEEVEAASKAAFAHEFIENLPNGYQTIVGENGTLLSGGQKQRLTIARALLKNPDILIFDEATSALDTKSEEMIRLALEEISKTKTVIMISHRMSLIEKMDRILMIQNGEVIEMTKNVMPKENLELKQI